MFKKRSNNKKQQFSLEDEPGQIQIESKPNPIENEGGIQQVNDELDGRLPTFKKPTIQSAILSESINDKSDDYEDEYNFQQGEKNKQKKLKGKRFGANTDADLDLRNIAQKKGGYDQVYDYDIHYLTKETAKLNEETSNLIEKMKEEKQNGDLDIEIEDKVGGEIMEEEQTQTVINIVDESEQGYSTKLTEEISRIKELRSVSRNVISKDDYIGLCGKIEDNIMNAKSDSGRMAMIGEESNSKARASLVAEKSIQPKEGKDQAKVKGFGKKSSAFEEDLNGISDDEFNEMEDRFVQEALKQPNIVDRDFSYLHTSKSLAQLKKKKEEQLILANLEAVTLRSTIDRVESAHLINLKVTQSNAQKIQNIEQVIQKAKEDIHSWSEQIEDLRLSERKAVTSLSFWQEFNEMICEKSKEVHQAQKELEKLNSEFLKETQVRRIADSNSYRFSLGVRLLTEKNSTNQQNYCSNLQIVDLSEIDIGIASNEVEETSVKFQADIRRIARKQRSNNPPSATNSVTHQVDGYSSDEDTQSKESGQIFSDFSDKKVALASAALEIMDEIEDDYSDFAIHLQAANLFCTLEEDSTPDQAKEIVCRCSEEFLAIQLFAFDPLKRFGDQMVSNINDLPFFKQIDRVLSQYPEVQIETEDNQNGEFRNIGQETRNIILKVKQQLLEKQVMEKIQSEIKNCYNPYSEGQTQALVDSMLQMIEAIYKNSKFRSSETLSIIQRTLSCIVKKFEEYARFTSYDGGFEQSSGTTYATADADYSQNNDRFLEFQIGRNLKLACNFVGCRKIIPLSNIVNLACTNLLQANLRMVQQLRVNSFEKKAFLLGKVSKVKSESQLNFFLLKKQLILSIPSEVISMSEQIQSFMAEINVHFVQYFSQIGEHIPNLTPEEIEKLSNFSESIMQ